MASYYFAPEGRADVLLLLLDLLVLPMVVHADLLRSYVLAYVVGLYRS
jgi:hypothetical protein